MKSIRSILAASAVLAATSAFAGPMQDFETALRAAYAPYRSALFMTSTNKPEEATKAVAAFAAAWGALAATPVPPQYDGDADYAATFTDVAAINDKAAATIAAGNLAEAHEELEAILDKIAGLHARAGLVGFSDRMNAYHARMEEVLANPAKPDLAADLAVLDYLYADLKANPPADADDSFNGLMAGVGESLDKLRAALASGDAEAAKAAATALKPPYSKLFLKFG